MKCIFQLPNQLKGVTTERSMHHLHLHYMTYTYNPILTPDIVFRISDCSSGNYCNDDRMFVFWFKQFYRIRVLIL